MSSADAFSSLAADVPVELAEGFAEVGDVKLHYVQSPTAGFARC